MCAIALANRLPNDIEITLIDTADADATDVFYGNVTSQTSYDFLLSLGITEPELLLETDTAFSLGTRYENWGLQKRYWTQSFHIPLPIFEGVDFHHFVIRHHQTSARPCSLEPYIMSVQAAEHGVFAHPPEGRKIPLASVEYGYQFSPKSWTDFFKTVLTKTRVKQIKQSIKAINRENEIVLSLSLDDGTTLKADFYIDCSGQEAILATSGKRDWHGNRELRALSSFEKSETLGAVKRTLTATEYGWNSETPLRQCLSYLTICAPETQGDILDLPGEENRKIIDVKVGHLDKAWEGNCLSLGHSAAIMEPLTPAPIMLLQRDICRLLELFPVSDDMRIDSREYNRRFTDDYMHAGLFQRAFFTIEGLPDTPYWSAAQKEPVCEKLEAKISQFKSRGVFVKYDYEPFNQQDWAILHFGLGHIPKRYDPLADRIEKDKIEKTLTQMRLAITQMAEKMPPLHVYMLGLLKYLKEKHG